MFSANGYGALGVVNYGGIAAAMGLTPEKVAKASACKKAGGSASWNQSKRDYDLTGCPEVSGDTWWSRQSTGIKAGIVVGGLGLLGVVGYMVLGGKKQTAIANRRRRRRAR